MKKRLILTITLLFLFNFMIGCSSNVNNNNTTNGNTDDQRIFSSLEGCGGRGSCVPEMKEGRLTGNYIKLGMVKEGEYFEPYFVSPEDACEEGLIAIRHTAPINDSWECWDCDCEFPPHVCTKCGNRRCGIGENKCNCPKDCPEDCSGLGQIGNQHDCCEGLHEIPSGYRDGVIYCTSEVCGDGHCRSVENGDNCPEDCE
jgi:hypothetical protein